MSNLLLENFEALADAPSAIPKLRELVLQLAVRGKLVPQDPNDEPASELLVRICGEGLRSARSGRMRRSAPVSAVGLVLAPYELPRSWRWVRLAEVGDIVGGGTPPSGDASNFSEAGVPWLTPADMRAVSGKYVGRGSRDLSDAGLARSSATLMPAGTVLFSSRAPIGYVAIAANEVSTNQGFKSVVPHLVSMNEYIYCFLVSAARDIDRNAPGTTFKEISGKAMAQIAMPLPPLPEQKRIVAKVDELMARCDELEAKQQVRRTKLFALNRASLRALTEPDRASLAPAWRRVREHFDHLYATPETVTELRQTILQLAVMGRLVPQDPNDEPALELLKRIQAEKRGQTVRNSTTGAGRTRGSRATPPVVPDRVPHALPGNWAWCRAEELLLSISDGDHQPPPRSSTGIPFLVIGNVSSGKLDFSGVRHVPMEYYRRLDQIRVPRQGDVLYTVTGSYGIAVVVDTQKEFCVQRHMAILKCPKDVLPRLVALWLSSPGALDQAVAGATGIAQQTVSLGVLRALLLPIPPLAEQKRIVARVDELLGLCDDLEIRLQQTQVRSDELLAAVMREIVGGVGPE